MTINNREIKFNAWLGNYGINAMAKVIDIDFAGISIRKGDPSVKCEGYENDGCFSLSDTPIVQYTGRKDRNGREIYDKDIFYNHDRDCNQLVRWDDIRISTPAIPNINSYNEGPMYLDLINRFSIEVIGNVFENPELIDTKQKND